jgi:hypothetical protein
MPMAPYTRLDFGSRIKAIREVAIALTQPTFNIPAQTASADMPACVYWINKICDSRSLPRFSNLDYTGFLQALNILVAQVP